MRTTLRLTITLFITLLIGITGSAILGITYVDSKETVVESAHQLIQQIGTSTEERVASYLSATHRAVLLTKELVDDRVLDPANVEAMEAYFRKFLNTHPTVSMMSYVDIRGHGLLVERQPDGSYRVLMDSDTRTKPWFAYWAKSKADLKSLPAHWTNVFVLDREGNPGIACSVPQLDGKGRLESVFGVEIGLLDLSLFLATHKIGISGKSFITDRNEQLFALPDPAEIFEKKASSGGSLLEFRTLRQSHYPELGAFGELEEVRRTYRTGKKSRHRFTSGAKSYLASLAPVSMQDGPDWFVGVVVPEDDFLGDLKKTLRLTAQIVAAVLIISFLLGLIFSRYLARVLRQLAKEAGRIRNLDFDTSQTGGTPFAEINEVLTAFEGMKMGLRSFSRYIPSDVVRRLVEEKVEAKLGAEPKELTMFFSDIKGFTSISESMDGKALAESLGKYLEQVTAVIRSPDSQGVVDKYIGDAVMAFWGAPKDVDNHPDKACRAALRCQEAIADLVKSTPGMPDFTTRIGLHTDEVLVGNFGAAMRLNYTCVGNGVNLASRLEALNKQYGSSILVSEKTYQRTKESFEFRHLDRVAAKGFSSGVDVYELRGEKGSLTQAERASINAYEAALESYFRRDWETARAALRSLLKEAPEDAAVENLLRRIEKFITDPPSEDWSGVWVMTTK